MHPSVMYGSWLMITAGLLAARALSSGIPAPYGRYSRPGWGALIDARVAWVTQEIPCLLVPLWMWLTAPEPLPLPNKALLAMFIAHYTHRSLVYPLLVRGGKPTPLVVWALAAISCFWNGSLQGWWLTRWRDHKRLHVDAVFILGSLLWATGAAINLHSDHVLRTLRGPGETGHRIPRRGAFRLVSAAHYFGELVEWGGWAMAARTLPSLAFFIYSVCNLAPRANHHHMWYKEQFRDYPNARKALIPFVW